MIREEVYTCVARRVELFDWEACYHKLKWVTNEIKFTSLVNGNNYSVVLACRFLSSFLYLAYDKRLECFWVLKDEEKKDVVYSVFLCFWSPRELRPTIAIQFFLPSDRGRRFFILDLLLLHIHMDVNWQSLLSEFVSAVEAMFAPTCPTFMSGLFLIAIFIALLIHQCIK